MFHGLQTDLSGPWLSDHAARHKNSACRNTQARAGAMARLRDTVMWWKSSRHYVRWRERGGLQKVALNWSQTPPPEWFGRWSLETG